MRSRCAHSRGAGIHPPMHAASRLHVPGRPSTTPSARDSSIRSRGRQRHITLPIRRSRARIHGADALMIVRAAQGRPWILREIGHFLATGALPCPRPEVHRIREGWCGHARPLFFYGGARRARVPKHSLYTGLQIRRFPAARTRSMARRCARRRASSSTACVSIRRAPLPRDGRSPLQPKHKAPRRRAPRTSGRHRRKVMNIFRTSTARSRGIYECGQRGRAPLLEL